MRPQSHMPPHRHPRIRRGSAHINHERTSGHALNDPALEGREVGGGEIIIVVAGVSSSRLFFLPLFLFLFLFLFFFCFSGNETASTIGVLTATVEVDGGATTAASAELTETGSAAAAAATTAAARCCFRILRRLLVSRALSSCCCFVCVGGGGGGSGRGVGLVP